MMSKEKVVDLSHNLPPEAKQRKINKILWFISLIMKAIDNIILLYIVF